MILVCELFELCMIDGLIFFFFVIGECRI